MKIIVSVFLLVITILGFFWWQSDFALPIFCTTRGCVTTLEWNLERVHQVAFAQATRSNIVSEEAILTTLVRRHLIMNAGNAAANIQEAIQYRTNILHLTDESQVRHIGFDSFTQYDERVTIPFLLQESYIKQHSFKSSQEAYAAISQNFSVISLLFGYTWDSSKGEVVAR